MVSASILIFVALIILSVYFLSNVAFNPQVFLEDVCISDRVLNTQNTGAYAICRPCFLNLKYIDFGNFVKNKVKTAGKM